MTLQSMTGFSRVDGSQGNFSWSWELKSVNGKGLDVRWRLPFGYDFLEPELKSLVAKQLTRGNLQINLALDAQSVEKLPVINEAVLDAVVKMAEIVSARTNVSAPSIGDLLAVKGVVEYSTVTSLEDEQTAIHNQALLVSFQEAVTGLANARLSEGAAIEAVLLDQVAQIEKLKLQIEADPSRSAEAIKKSLSEKISALLNDGASLDEQRLYQEAAILATKADLQEELDRLAAHCVAARKLLGSEGAVGRKLDFLAQEFNRECNTVCSKANSTPVTQSGLQMKVVIDQFREQIQNIQ
ncbi:MAG: YicC family protein [Rhizobiales bacterium]|nr:YicC family protein [Hyphomicrobiales bacterium]